MRGSTAGSSVLLLSPQWALARVGIAICRLLFWLSDWGWKALAVEALAGLSAVLRFAYEGCMMRLPTAALSSVSASFGVTCVGLVSVFDAFRAGFGGFRWAHFARRRDEGCCCFRSWDLGTRRHTPSERLRCKARAGSGCRPSPWLRSLSGPGGTASRSPMAMRGRLRAVVLPRPVWVRRLASCGSFASVRHRPGATVGSLCRSLSALHRGLTIPMPLRPLRYA